MSDNWIIVIPENPDYIPPLESRQKAEEYFRSIAPRSDEVKEEATEEFRCIDCGGNLSKIICPACGAELKVQWWLGVMDEEAKAGSPLRPVTLPCCSAQSSLGRLQYDWPQGVARFTVETMNPGLPDLTDAQKRVFETILGCRVRVIRQHI